MLDIGKLYPLLSSILGESKPYTNNEYYFFCPFCSHHKPKLAVNLGTGKWHCWTCFAAGRRLISLFKKLNVNQEQIKELKLLLNEEVIYIKNDGDDSVSELKLPSEYCPLWKPKNTIKYKHALYYLKNRGITAQDIIKYRLGYCEIGRYADRIIIPSYNKDGKLNYYVSRAFFDGMFSYVNPPVSKNIIGFENLILWKCPVVIVEGVFDALAVKRNAIPLFGKTLNSSLKTALIQNKVTDVYLALDTDAIKSTIKIAQELMMCGINIYHVSLNEKDPSAMGFEKITRAIKKAEKIDFSALVNLKMQ